MTTKSMPRSQWTTAVDNDFLKDPQRETSRIAARADRRNHVKYVISSHELDVNTRLIRSGSSHALERTETTASHQADLKKYYVDQDLLKMLG